MSCSESGSRSGLYRPSNSGGTGWSWTTHSSPFCPSSDFPGALRGSSPAKLRLRFPPFRFEQAAFEGEVAVLGEGGLELGHDLLRRGGVAIEEIDRGHRQQFGR